MTATEPTQIPELTTKEIAAKILTLVDGTPDEASIKRAINIAKDIQADIAAIKHANGIEWRRLTLHSTLDLAREQVNLKRLLE